VISKGVQSLDFKVYQPLISHENMPCYVYDYKPSVQAMPNSPIAIN